MKGFARIKKRSGKNVIGLKKLLRFICDGCRDKRHGDCLGGTWCDCQHRVPK